LLDSIENRSELEDYLAEVKTKTELDRMTFDLEKTGLEIKGLKAIHPLNNKELKIFVADYVLPNYGSGAIMAGSSS